MDRELKKGPGGHYGRDQWVISGYLPDRGQYDMAFFCQWLGDHGPVQAIGGEHDSEVMRSHMQEAEQKMLALLRKQIEAGIASHTNFLIGPADTHEVHVVYWTSDTAPTHVYKITVKKSGQKSIVVADPFAENWDDEELAEKIEDAAMEMAARDPHAEHAAEEEGPSEQTLGELLGYRLHATTLRNSPLRFGKIIAEELGPAVTRAVIAAIDAASWDEFKEKLCPGEVPAGEAAHDDTLAEEQDAMGPLPKPTAEEEAPEPTLGVLLGRQLRAVSLWNLSLIRTMRLGEILAEKLSLEVAETVIAAMEETQDEFVAELSLGKVLAAEAIGRSPTAELEAAYQAGQEATDLSPVIVRRGTMPYRIDKDGTIHLSIPINPGRAAVSALLLSWK